MRLGLFNGNPSNLLFGNIGANQVCTQEHQDLALEAARNSIVLLKNSDRLLPLSKTKTTSLAVIGPNANALETLLGNYRGPPCKSISPLQALQGYVKNTMYHPGCDWVNCTSVAIDKAVKIAEAADYVVLVMGLDQSQEMEDHDREDLVLLGNQQSLVASVAKAAKKPIVLVLLCGGPVDVSFAKEDPKIGGILWAGYPGEAGGIALAEIIFGEHNPVLSTGTELCEKAKFSAFIGVKNHGEMEGKHPVLLYVRQARPRNGSPMKQLVGFHSVSLKARERVEIEFALNACEHLSRANEDGLMVIEEGSRYLIVGDEEYPITVRV